MINMVNEFKLCTPKPDADLCMRVDLPLDRKTVENEEWATGPPGLRAAGPSRAVGRGPLGLRAAGPWRAVGRGPLGRGPAFSKTLHNAGINLGNLSLLFTILGITWINVPMLITILGITWVKVSISFTLLGITWEMCPYYSQVWE